MHREDTAMINATGQNGADGADGTPETVLGSYAHTYRGIEIHVPPAPSAPFNEKRRSGVFYAIKKTGGYPMVHWTPEMIDTARAMALAGNCNQRIADALGISPRTYVRWLIRTGVSQAKAAPPAGSNDNQGRDVAHRAPRMPGTTIMAHDAALSIMPRRTACSVAWSDEDTALLAPYARVRMPETMRRQISTLTGRSMDAVKMRIALMRRLDAEITTGKLRSIPGPRPIQTVIVDATPVSVLRAQQMVERPCSTCRRIITTPVFVRRCFACKGPEKLMSQGIDSSLRGVGWL